MTAGRAARRAQLAQIMSERFPEGGSRETRDRKSEAHAAAIQCIAELDRGLQILDQELRRGQFNAARVSTQTLRGIVGILVVLALMQRLSIRFQAWLVRRDEADQ